VAAVAALTVCLGLWVAWFLAGGLDR
jgi:hypothetical protein